MTRTRSLLAAFLLAVLAVVLVPGSAWAADPGTVAQALRDDPVYVDPRADVSVDADRLRQEIGNASRPVYVAVLPAAAAQTNGGRIGLNTAIGKALGRNAVLFTVAGGQLAGGASQGVGLGPGQADSIARSNQGGDVTKALVESIREASSATSGAAGSSSNRQGAGTATSSGGGGSGATILGVLVLIGVVVAALLFGRSRKRKQGAMEGSRADVESLYNRLGADVANLSPGDDAIARQALADAAERYNATGALLAKADTPGEFAAARRTVVEGLTAARLVRQRLGLDPGPEIPPAPGEGPQLQAAERVQIGDQQYDGSPVYAPGRQHYFRGGYLGGQMVPGGWYGVPFWETMLIGSALSGGFGGFGYGGGGFERGYEEGVEDAREARDDGGYDGGGYDDRSSGGGDWGGGGGDWGGGGGGGDWGGGGGGDNSGGSW